MAHFHAKVEHPFRVIKRQFGFEKTRLRDMLKNCCKVKVLVALSNLYMVRNSCCAVHDDGSGMPIWAKHRPK